MKQLIIACLCGLALALCTADPPAESPAIDAFFDTFTADWVRMSPDQAIAARYFTGPEQDALETGITPLTRDWRGRRVASGAARPHGLMAFDRKRLTETQRVSADLMKWQLEWW